MFLEKRRRFFRRYEFTVTPRKTTADALPMWSEDFLSVGSILIDRIVAELATEVQPNGDVVDLVEIDIRPDDGIMVLLFQRASPNAADPIYRLKTGVAKGGRSKTRRKHTLRQISKQDGEEQAVSAHMVVSLSQRSSGAYGVILEEIPKMSMAVLEQILRQALTATTYQFKGKAKKLDETYTLLKSRGVKSESLNNALKTGNLGVLTLTRQAKPDYVDNDGFLEPQLEVMKIKVVGRPPLTKLKARLQSLFSDAQDDGWQSMKLAIGFDDNRQRSVAIERGDEAKEILFVRSDEVDFSKDLQPCSNDIVEQVVTESVKLLAKGDAR